MFNRTSVGVTKPTDQKGQPISKQENASARASRLPGDNAGGGSAQKAEPSMDKKSSKG